MLFRFGNNEKSLNHNSSKETNKNSSGNFKSSNKCFIRTLSRSLLYYSVDASTVPHTSKIGREVISLLCEVDIVQQSLSIFVPPIFVCSIMLTLENVGGPYGIVVTNLDFVKDRYRLAEIMIIKMKDK